jgi:hypothetical protein
LPVSAAIRNFKTGGCLPNRRQPIAPENVIVQEASALWVIHHESGELMVARNGPVYKNINQSRIEESALQAEQKATHSNTPSEYAVWKEE